MSSSATTSATPTDADLDALVAQLDLPGKVRLLTGATAFSLAAEPAIGLAAMNFSDGPTGVRGLKFTGGEIVALFPNATLIASSWSDETAREVGTIVADEAQRQQISVVLGPTINLHRSALGGRLFEQYSEDPLLTGRVAAGYVRGVQSGQVGACLKHLVANEAETDRNSVDDVVDEATLRELYLLPFQIAVDDADAWTMMAAYNDVNGVTCTEHQHINLEIVRGEWGYDGLIMSDWFATKTTAASANGGLDLVMPGPVGPWGDKLVAAVENGEVSEATIDQHVRHLLRLASRVGALGAPRNWPTDLPAPDGDGRKEAFTRIAAQGMTVVANDGVLPLDAAASVALIGRPAIETLGMGGGSAMVNPPYVVSLADALPQHHAGQVTVVDGPSVRSRPAGARVGTLTAPDGSTGVEVAFLRADGSVISAQTTREARALVGFVEDDSEQPDRVRFTCRTAIDGPATVGVLGRGEWTLTLDGVQQQVSFPERTGSQSAVEGEDILRPPAWTTQVSGPVDLVATGRADGIGMLGVVCEPQGVAVEQAIADAVEAARASEVAVVVVGLTEEQETEAADKTTLALPGRQDDLVAAVAAAAKEAGRKTVVVVNAATPVLMPWLHDVDAVLIAGIPGQEAGSAIAAALSGEIEPAGRLVTSYPASDGASPAWTVTPVNGTVDYAEGRYVGYRGYFAEKAPEPLFWFGHGLGYSTWEYGDAVVEPAGGGPVVTLRIKNTGARRSREVVQVYYQPSESDQPVRLAGWSVVELDPGATSEVGITCDPRVLRYWDAAADQWRDLADDGEFLVARGLADIRQRVSL